jgi:hypothetical protein
MRYGACDDFRRQLRVDYFVFHALSPLFFFEALSFEDPAAERQIARFASSGMGKL